MEGHVHVWEERELVDEDAGGNMIADIYQVCSCGAEREVPDSKEGVANG